MKRTSIYRKVQTITYEFTTEEIIKALEDSNNDLVVPTEGWSLCWDEDNGTLILTVQYQEDIKDEPS